MMNPELELSKDQLWKFQLRREHAILLEEMNTQKEAFRAFAEEANGAHESLQEQITGLKCKFDKLADDNEKHGQEIRDNVGDVQKQIAELDKIKADLQAVGMRVRALEEKENSVLELIATTPAPAPKAPQAGPTKASTTSSIRRTSPKPTTTSKASTKPAHNVANTSLRKSRRQAHQEPSPEEAPQTHYAPLPPAPLNQEAGASLAAFFDATDAVAAAVAPADHTLLAAMFVTGLAERDQQDAIVDALAQKGLSRALGNGQVEMQCGWEDLKTVLKTLGLLGGDAVGAVGAAAVAGAGTVVEKTRSHKKKGKK